MIFHGDCEEFLDANPQGIVCIFMDPPDNLGLEYDGFVVTGIVRRTYGASPTMSRNRAHITLKSGNGMVFEIPDDERKEFQEQLDTLIKTISNRGYGVDSTLKVTR